MEDTGGKSNFADQFFAIIFSLRYIFDMRRRQLMENAILNCTDYVQLEIIHSEQPSNGILALPNLF